MAYGVKYRTEYNRRSGSLTTIDILERDYASMITMLKPDGNPLEIQWSGDVNNIYQPTTGSGAIIRVFVTPLTMLDLMTNDPTKYMVIAYDGASGGTVTWQGFISADIYSENYSYATSILIPITIQCTDGMNLLDNIKYTETDGSFYTGCVTLATIVNNCLGKLGLTFNSIIVGTSLQVDSSSDLFTTQSLWNENFIDESREPMSCRQVLDSVIGGLGLTMCFMANYIVIFDPIDMHGTNWIEYDTAFANGGSAFTQGYKDITAKDIKWGETDSQLDIVPNFPEAIVRYDPYNFYEETYKFSNSINWTDPGTFVAQTGYQLNSTIEYAGWTFSPSDTFSIASRDTSLSSAEYMLQLNGSENVAEYTFPQAVLVEDENLTLRLSCQVFTQTKRSNANIFDPGASKTVNRIQIPIAIKIGTQFWKFNADWDTTDDSTKWQPLDVVGSEMHADYLTETINDKWVTAYIDAPVWFGDGTPLIGDVTVQIYDEFTNTFADPIIPAAEDFFSDVFTKTSSILDAGVTFTRLTDESIRITIVNFKTHVGIPAGNVLLDGAVTSITSAATYPIGGNYEDTGAGVHAYSSGTATTLYSVVSYTASTDTLVYDVTNSGGSYFTNFDHFLTGYATSIEYTTGYRSVIVFIKDVKLEVVDSLTRENIGNPGVEFKGTLSTNLTGKANFKVQTTCGTGTNGASRGAFKLVSDGNINIEGFSRTGDATVYNSANFILQNIVSQYKDARFKITGTFDATGQSLLLRTYLIKDSAYLGSRAFYIISGTYRDQEELMDFEMIEIEDTREAINEL